MRAAVFFDVDGTLVPRTSSSQYLAGFLGHLEELRRAEDAYAERRMDNRQVSVLDAAGWQGRTQDEVSDLLAGLPLVTGIREVVAWCRDHDVAPYLATLAWQPVGRFLCDEFDFAGACGPVLAHRNGVYTGGVDQHLDEFDKRDFALRVAADLGLPASACAAVGDSRSDLPLFTDVGFSIAFNADEALRAVATENVTGTDLRAVVEPLERWLGATQTSGWARPHRGCPE
ncbi:MAG: haloacid dehalogenase-like hydrolase [Blastococcus sp.]|nr:haloacid dehalogenase-like hydrolase [Blastococcus sp.]